MHREKCVHEECELFSIPKQRHFLKPKCYAVKVRTIGTVKKLLEHQVSSVVISNFYLFSALDDNNRVKTIKEYVRIYVHTYMK